MFRCSPVSSLGTNRLTCPVDALWPFRVIRRRCGGESSGSPESLGCRHTWAVVSSLSTDQLALPHGCPAWGWSAMAVSCIAVFVEAEPL